MEWKLAPCLQAPKINFAEVFSGLEAGRSLSDEQTQTLLRCGDPRYGLMSPHCPDVKFI
ncbi:hypothetical protein IV102_21680 [bacterium]|nr:hypothetical protein [bacterium]